MNLWAGLFLMDLNQPRTSFVFFHKFVFVIARTCLFILSRVCLLTLPISVFVGFIRRHFGSVSKFGL